jgi:signal transduction histidine kinase
MMSDSPHSGGAARDSEASLARMLVALVNERDLELARVSRLLHDEISQVLSAVGLQLDVMRMDFAPLVPEIAGRTAEIQSVLEQAIVHLRDLSYELNPSVVERAGLQSALDRLVGRIRQSFAGHIRLHYDAIARIPTAPATVLFKIAEYAVEQASKQPGCKQIEIHVKRAQGEFVLDVTDDRPKRAKPGPVDSPQAIGKLLAEYYAAQSGVTLTENHVPARGTTVRAAVPAPDSNAGS